jgi:hypothetical protein
MLIGLVVVHLNIQIQAGVGEIPVHSVPQGAIWSSVYVSVQEGKATNSASMVNLMVGWMLLRRLRSSSALPLSDH